VDLIVRIDICVVQSLSRFSPGADDVAENAAGDALAVGYRSGPRWDPEGVGHWTGIRGVEVEVCGVDDGVLVAGFVGDYFEDVGVAIPATERWESPVHGNGGDHAIMVVEGAVHSPLQRSRNSASEKDGEDVVVIGVCLILVEGQDDEGIVHEVAVAQERGKKGPCPIRSEINGCIVTIVGHVRGDE